MLNCSRPEAKSEVQPQPIRNETWRLLQQANVAAVAAGWAASGVFATGVGPEYLTAGPTSLLYVGKSAGPLASLVGSSLSLSDSLAASRRWMVERQNRRSAFWQMIERIDPTRRSIAWTNLIKMDRVGGALPPNVTESASVWAACQCALEDELEFLRPRVIIFATSDYLRGEVVELIERRGMTCELSRDADGWTGLWRSPSSTAIVTKHPLGWDRRARERVIALATAALADVR